jgi:hypothetical protein
MIAIIVSSEFHWIKRMPCKPSAALAQIIVYI